LSQKDHNGIPLPRSSTDLPFHHRGRHACAWSLLSPVGENVTLSFPPLFASKLYCIHVTLPHTPSPNPVVLYYSVKATLGTGTGQGWSLKASENIRDRPGDPKSPCQCREVNERLPQSFRAAMKILKIRKTAQSTKKLTAPAIIV
jgi:hypothetical protein